MDYNGVMVKNMKSKMTLERLAVMTMRGFQELRDELRDELRGISARLDRLEARMGSLEQRVASLEERVTRLEENASILRRDMETGFEEVRQNFKQVREDIASMEYGPEIHDLKNRVTRLEKKAGAR